VTEWWDILLLQITANSVGERILKIGQHLAKLAANKTVALFSEHGV